MLHGLNLHGANVLVTGATGFIGGRLTEYLSLHFHANVHALVRNYGRAVHLARLPVKLVHGDLLCPDSLSQAVIGCDIIFHCAVAASGEDNERRNVTVDGTTHLLNAAVKAKVRRFVHVSTIAVHGPDPGAEIDENTPLSYSNDVYADAKIDAEKIAFQYLREWGLPLTVLRPTIVYGPRAAGWTIAPLTSMKQGVHKLFNGGVGIANHVYVDDVVQALLLAAVHPNAVGEAFTISHGTSVTWKEFFGYYARMLGVELSSISVDTIHLQRRRLEQLRNPINWGLTFLASPRAQSIAREVPGLTNTAGLISRAVPPYLKQKITNRAAMLRETKLNPPKLPRQWLIDLFCAQGRCKIDKAQRLLGYQPQFPLNEGMRLTEEWLRHVNLL